MKCEICHKEEATGTKWFTAEQTDIHVAGIYRVCHNHGGPKIKDRTMIVPHV